MHFLAGINTYSLHIILFSPLLGAAFVALVPKERAGLVNVFGRIFLVPILLCLTMAFFFPSVLGGQANFALLPFVFDKGAIQFHFGPTELILSASLCLCVIALFLVLPETIEKLGKHFISCALLLVFAANFVILSQDASAKLIVSHFALWVFNYLVALYGKTYRGKAILLTLTFFVAIDSAALFVNHFHPLFANEPKTEAFLMSVLSLPAFSRLVLTMAAPWYRTLTSICRAPILVLLTATFIPMGFSLLLDLESTFKKTVLPSKLLLWLALFSVISAAIAALFSLTREKHNIIFFQYIPIFTSLLIVTLLFCDKQGMDYHVGLISLLILGVTVALLTEEVFWLLGSKFDQARLLRLLIIFLFIGVPGVGIGSFLWLTLGASIKGAYFWSSNENAAFLLAIGIVWMAAFLVQSYGALVAAMRRPVSALGGHPFFSKENLSSTMINRVWIAIFLVFLIGLFLPIWQLSAS